MPTFQKEFNTRAAGQFVKWCQPVFGPKDVIKSGVALMAELLSQEAVQEALQAGAEEAVHATTLIARIVSTWEAQLSEDQTQKDAAQRRQRQDATAEAAPRQQLKQDPNCLACQGRHRPHTCK